jgi:hypothetical protein
VSARRHVSDSYSFNSSDSLNDFALSDSGHPFERESPKWREAGWQKPNPVADLKTSGLLALRCMRYLGQNYPADTLRMVASQKENIKSHYPFAVVGINMTLMLSEVLGIREKRFQDRQEANSGFFEMFEDKHAFYEACSVTMLLCHYIYYVTMSLYYYVTILLCHIYYMSHSHR